MRTEVPACCCQRIPQRRQFDATIANDDGTGLLLLGQPHIDQTMFLHIFGCVDALKSRKLDTTATLLQFFQCVERQGSVDHRGNGNRKPISQQQPDTGEQGFLECAEIIQPANQGNYCDRHRRRDDAVGDRAVKHHIDAEELDMNHVRREQHHDIKRSRHQKFKVFH